MNLNKILMDIRGVSSPDKWLTLNKIIYDKLNNDKKCNYEEFCYFLKEFNINRNNILYIKDNIFNNLYISLGNGTYISGIVLDKEYFQMFNIKDAIIHLKKQQLENIQTKNYSAYFMMIPVQFKTFEFEKIYKLIPEELVYEVWKDIYISCDYSFHNCNQEILYELLLNKKTSNKTSKKSKEIKKIKIYRGMNSLSTDIEKALSWTTSYKVAKTFARDKDMPIVLSAEVYKNDIIDFINDRDEEEVLVFYRDLQNIQIEKI